MGSRSRDNVNKSQPFEEKRETEHGMNPTLSTPCHGLVKPGSQFFNQLRHGLPDSFSFIRCRG